MTVQAGRTLLDACDAAARYVPRLCFHAAVGCGCTHDADCATCGLCAVRLADGSVALACCTEANDGDRVSTDDPELRRLRAERLAVFLARHPHVCLSCPEREGCSRDQCLYGHPKEARCCDELGRCELGKLVAFVDPQVLIPRRAVSVSRCATVEGRVRREPGLCVGCGRCVRICSHSREAGDALEMVGEVALPKGGTLRDSGCTFCGLCVLFCPTGALTALGSAGAAWLAARRERHRLPLQVLPPSGERQFRIPEGLAAVPAQAGVLTLLDGSGDVLRIAGVPDLAQAVAGVLAEVATSGAAWLRFEVQPLYTQRETELLAQYVRDYGQLPRGNDLGDDLFADDLD